MMIDEIRRKTIVTTITAWFMIPFFILYMLFPDSLSSLSISRNGCIAAIVGAAVYYGLRTWAVLKYPGWSMRFYLSFFIVDLIAMTFAIMVTGGYRSVFFNLYWATVLSGAMMFGVRGSLLSSAGVVLSFLFASLFSWYSDPSSMMRFGDILLRLYPVIIFSFMVSYMVREGQRIRLEKQQVEEQLEEEKQEKERLQEAFTEKALTNRELQVLKLVHDGLNNREIAAELFISESTVKKHIGNILEKLEVDNRIQAAVIAEQKNMLQIPDS